MLSSQLIWESWINCVWSVDLLKYSLSYDYSVKAILSTYVGSDYLVCSDM
jgi:hypothetical protein